MAAENCLWGAPRIHGELLKLGITISERTVSRYLCGRPTTQSQTWRTFFANHFSGQTSISPVMFADAHDEDIVLDASEVSLRQGPSIDASYSSIHGPTVDWGRSHQLSLEPRPTSPFRTVQERARAAAVVRLDIYRSNQPRSVRAVGFLSCATTMPSRPKAV